MKGERSKLWLILLCSFDVSDSVAYGLDAFCLVVGDLDAEFLFEFHDELNGVEAVCAKIGSERCGFGYLFFVYAKFVNDDGYYARCNFRHNFSVL